MSKAGQSGDRYVVEYLDKRDAERVYTWMRAYCEETSLDLIAASYRVEPDPEAIITAIATGDIFPPDTREAAARGCRDGLAARRAKGGKS